MWQMTGKTTVSGHPALGRVRQRLHSLVFVETADGIRVISFRKANQREVKRYEKATQS